MHVALLPGSPLVWSALLAPAECPLEGSWPVLFPLSAADYLSRRRLPLLSPLQDAIRHKHSVVKDLLVISGTLPLHLSLPPLLSNLDLTALSCPLRER